MSDSMIEALEAELAGYVMRGLDDRAAAVRAEMDRIAPKSAPKRRSVKPERAVAREDVEMAV